MLNQELLIAYLADALTPAERVRAEIEIAKDPDAQRALAHQQLMDQALRVALGGPEADERVKQAVLAVLGTKPIEQLRAQVLADVSPHRHVATPGSGSEEPEPRPAVLTRHTPAWRRLLRVRLIPILLGEIRARRRLRLVAVALAALAIGFVLFSVLQRTPSPSEIGHFSSVVGTPTIHRPSGRGVIDARVSASVQFGDDIDTGDADMAEIRFNDGTRLRLNFNTAVKIPRPDRASPRARWFDRTTPPRFQRPPEIQLLRGDVWTKVQKATNAPELAVRTPVATAVAKGTEFGLALRTTAKGEGRALAPNSKSQPPQLVAVLTVREGAVEFSNEHGTIEATGMTESTATSEGAPSQPIRLQTLKSFELGDGKALGIHAEGSGFNLYESAIRLVYPQGWAGFELLGGEDASMSTTAALRICRVWPGSPADQAGLAVGDVITHINGQPAAHPREALGPVLRAQNTPVAVTVTRDGTSRTTSFTTREHPYAPPIPSLPDDLAAALFEATWPLIETGFEESSTTNRWGELQRNLDHLLQRYPGAAAVHNNLGEWYWAKDETGLAVRHFQMAIALDPGGTLYHYNLGRILRDIGNFERSVQEDETAVQLAPTWVPAACDLALAYSVLTRHEEALAAVERGLGAHPEAGALWSIKALILLNTGRSDDALAAARRLVELEPADASAYCNLGSILWVRGESDAAEAAHRKAIELDPDWARAHEGLGMVFQKRLGGRLYADPVATPPEDLTLDRWQNREPDQTALLTEAQRHFRKVIELKPDDAQSHQHLGQSLLEHGEIDEATEMFRKAIELDPSPYRIAGIDNELAWLFAIWGIRLDEALQRARHAVQLFPSDYGFLDTLGLVHFRRGEWDDAEWAWIQCIKLAGPQGDPVDTFRLGKVYEKKNQPEAAAAAYEEALRIKPDHPHARQALEQLGQLFPE